MVQWKRIREFIVFTFTANFALVGIYLLLNYFLGFTEKFPYSMTILGTIYMFVPMTVSFILIKVRYKEKPGDYGLKINFNPYLLLSWILPVIIVIGTISISLILKIGTLDLSFSGFLEDIKVQMGEEAYMQVQQQMKNAGFLLMSIQVLVGGTTINAIAAFGEEMGWRGFLYKELKPLGFWKSGLLIGTIWGIWHSPLILMGHNFPGHPYLGVVVMTIACIPLGLLIQYVRSKTKTVFSAAIMHGMFNAAGGFAIITINGGSYLFKNVVGISGIITMSFLVLILFLLMKGFRRVRI